MTEFRQTGGAKVGLARATYPFAKLIADANRLELNAGLMGRFLFRPADVISVEPESAGIFDLKAGVRITHSVPGYNKEVVFYPSLSSQAGDVITGIQQTGFLDNRQTIPPAVETEITELQNAGSLPFKKGAGIMVVVIWNLLFIPFLLLLLRAGIPAAFSSRLMALPPAYMVVLCLLVLFIPAVRALLLKPAHRSTNIRTTILFILLICSVLFTAMMLVPAPSGF